MRLLAKSWDEKLGTAPPHIYLPNHLEDVWQASLAVVNVSGAWQLNALGLPLDSYLDRFRWVVGASAILHDLGKSNDHFQKMIHGRSSEVDVTSDRQAIRHEWITWFILQLPGWKEWILSGTLQPSCDEDWRAILWSVTGHHPAARRDCPPKVKTSGCRDKVVIYLDLAINDVKECISLIEARLKLRPELRPNLSNHNVSSDDVLAVINTWSNSQHQWMLETRKDPHARMFLDFVAASKNCLMAADVAGSALPNTGFERSSFENEIVSGLLNAPSCNDLDELIQDRLTDANSGKVNSLRPFQKRVADESGDVTLVTAGCGSGKTLAAYHWARTHYPNRKLYICYPTTGTATEGFRDYLFDEYEHKPKFKAKLFHGRASVDRALILEAESFDDTEADDTFARIETLQAWSTPIVSCTVDQVLGLMANHRRSIYAWPALASSVFVFDEIHSYDECLFGALLRFVKSLKGVPVLLMTASLPKHRHEQLNENVSRRGSKLIQIHGPEELEGISRYHKLKRPQQKIREDVEEALSNNGKVLWVANTVNRAIDVALEYSDLHPTVYHSRFCYEDRVIKHKELIEHFRDPNRAAFAICTQVAEMSLDISATLLVTDLAPIPALIQRLGRLNRWVTENGKPTCPFIIVQPYDHNGKFSSLPYSEQELIESSNWLNELPNIISQSSLVATWEQMSGLESELLCSTDSTWLDDGYRRQVSPLRHSTGISVIRSEDLPLLKSQRKQLAEVILPMNSAPHLNWQDWPRHRGVPIAPEGSIHYDKHLGGRWIDKRRHDFLSKENN